MAFTDLGDLVVGGSTNASAAANQTSLAGSTVLDVAVGNLIVVVVAVDNPQNGGDAGVTAVTDSAGNVYTKAKQVCNAVAAQAGCSCSLWYSIATASMVGDGSKFITATFGTASTSDASAMSARLFSMGAGLRAIIEGTPGQLLHNTAADPGSLNVTTANVACLRIRGVAIQRGDFTGPTATASWTGIGGTSFSGIGTTGAEMCSWFEFRISTSTGAASDPTFPGTAINANVYVAFREAKTGVLGATEGADTALNGFTGTVAASTVTGTLAVTEGADTALNGFTGIAAQEYGPLAATEGADTASGGAAASLSFQSAVSNVSGAAFTCASAVGQERLVAILGIAQNPITSSAFTAVTIDGQAATQVGATIRQVDPANNGPIISFWRAPGTSGTSITVAVTDTGGFFDVRGLLWTLSNAGTLLDHNEAGYSSTGGTQSPLTVSVNTAAGGAAAAAFLGYDSSSHDVTWTGLTERADATTSLYGGDWTSAADLNTGSASTPLTVTAATPATTFASNSAIVAAAVSFNPSAGGGGFTGTVAWLGTLVATEGADVSAFTGTVVGATVTGTLAATESADAAAFTGTVRWLGTLAATEGTDTAAFTGLASAFGTLAATEGSDTAAFTGPLAVTGTLGATEARDAAAFTGTVQWRGTLAAIEERDAPAFTGTVSTSITIIGVLAATEGGVHGITADSTLITADSTLITADSDHTNNELAAFTGTVTGVAGTLAATEDRDLAAFRDPEPLFGILAAIEDSDIAFFEYRERTWGDVDQGLENEVARTTWLRNQSSRVVYLKSETQRITNGRRVSFT